MKIIFKGIVQGVGFRPTIYRVAKEMGLNGYVLNKGSEVEVVIDGDPNEFVKKLKENLPITARITKVTIKEDNRHFEGFRILKSKSGERYSPIPVDGGICDDCLHELFDPNNRRYLYPFTNCTVCGARFSLIQDLPYDRERTSMREFKLCEDCTSEYTDPMDKRYHAQTISCPKCGPSYRLYDKEQKEIDDPIKRFAEYIDKGAIGVIKSWGGMHLCCKLDKIEEFREWYKRPQKPFAVMVKDIAVAEKYVEITEDERKLLLSNRKPIVLAHKKNCEQVSPGLSTIGIYLPYTGLHHLLFSYMDTDALIMTSANIPGEPMLIDNKDVFSLEADVYLLHNRLIPNRIDDSVIKVWKRKTFFIRKSRGYVPDPTKINYKKSILSVGAEENVCGAISNNGTLYGTQYIGNTRYYPTLEFLERSLRHMMKLTGVKTLDGIGMDLHPLYNTRKIAEKFAEEHHARITEIQHHWAHAVSLLLDNKLKEGAVITIDGAGYGTDNTIWGGEVLYATYDNFERLGHLEYIPLIGGDRAIKDPRRLVFAIFKKLGKEKYFHDSKADILSKLIKKSPKTSSLGRILDALSCYLGICTEQTYEGEPAIKLEKYLENGNPEYKFDTEVKNGVIGTIEIFEQIEEHVKPSLSEKEKADLIYSAVKTIVDKLTEIAMDNAVGKKVGITGGVSYNIPIIEMVEKRLKKEEFELITHNNIPNGDGGISIGQNVIVGELVG